MREGRPVTSANAAPPAATAALERILETVVEGDGVAVIALDSEFTTEEAADLLVVSRLTLVERVEHGALPFQTLSVQGRIKAAEIVAYLERGRAPQDLALDAMVAENQRAGLYD